MPQVRLSPSFFRKERDQNYTDWPLANWRELFQNAIDQDASQINITLRPGDDNCVLLTFADNGPGMSRQVLNDVYFSIGESTKDSDPTKIGGMGRARILTCFAMKSYRIYSQDYEVVGAGADYEVYDHAWTTGCKLVVEVDGSNIDTLRAALERFLFESRLAARVFLNGEAMPNRGLNAGRHVRDLQVQGRTFARVFVNKSAEVARVLVRVKGVSMFTTSTNAKAQIIVEINPEASRSVLTASRDGLRGYYREALDRFLNELAVDTNSALRSRLNRRTTVIRGGGMRAVSRPEAKALRPEQNPVKEDERVKQAAAFYEAPVSVTEASDEPIDRANRQEELFDSWMNRTFGDIYLFDEASDPAIRKAITAYVPSNWKMAYQAGRNGNPGHHYRKGANIIRTLLMWTTAVRYALEVGLEPLGITSVRYGVGFVFPSDDIRADVRQLDGGYVFSLCPVDGRGRLDFSARDRTDLKRLMAYAKHEVTHLHVDWHGERYSTMREQIDVRFDEAECFRRMRAALASVQV